MRKILYLLLLPALFACNNPQPTEYHHTIITFGTLLEVTLSDISPELADTAFELLEEDYRNYHNSWTPWQESDLTKINTAIKHNKKIIPSPKVLPLIEQSIELSRISEGLFNPAIGELINLWQFHKHDDPNIKPPNKAEITKIQSKQPKMSDLIIDSPYLSSKNPNVQLNFGAFAKGYAIDLSFQKLHQMGINNAIINAGGDLRVSGTKGARLWNIGIKHPRKEGVIASVEMFDNESVFTSGDYERYFFHNKQRYHHILDPNTGYPTQGTTSVTVIHHNAAVADAAATALLVAGPARWHKIAKKLGIRYVMLIEEDGTMHMNPKMAERIKLKDAPKSSIVLSQPL